MDRTAQRWSGVISIIIGLINNKWNAPTEQNGNGRDRIPHANNEIGTF
jgi:hypothetical protein